jgi:hypothetical protein
MRTSGAVADSGVNTGRIWPPLFHMNLKEALGGRPPARE